MSSSSIDSAKPPTVLLPGSWDGDAIADSAVDSEAALDDNGAAVADQKTETAEASPISTTLEEDECSIDLKARTDSRPTSSRPIALQGALAYRKGHFSGAMPSWKKGFVVFDMRSGGVLSCHKPQQGIENQTRLISHMEDDFEEARIHLPARVDWVVKDIKNDSRCFVVEASLKLSSLVSFPEEEIQAYREVKYSKVPEEAVESKFIEDLSEMLPLPDNLLEDMNRARESGHPYRVYFKCSKSNEKSLWLQAFEELGRLSNVLHEKKGIMNLLGNVKLAFSVSRTRTHVAEIFAKEREFLRAQMTNDDDASINSESSSIHDNPGLRLRNSQTGENGAGVKEYLVYPLYAYPNRWMTNSELQTEVVKPSETFHDLRRSKNISQKEIGTLRVEILQCLGLPALDFASETDAVAYMVCGSYAFTSDVIGNKLNPLWLPRSRRACIFPIFHAYAKLFVGIFDDDGKGEKDDFAGRVVIAIARCRPRSTYDVTLPLRQSGHVYARVPRGSVRLRFSIVYNSERDALLSYLPKSMPSLKVERPDNDVTVVCGDEKAFRNIATTVHGIHMPGRFSFEEWRAVMREANFVRKVGINTIKTLLGDLIKWENPSMSMVVFVAWMHGVHHGAFSLVPVYLVAFLLMIMVKNYAFYGSDGPLQRGFVPPSFEELVAAIISNSHEPSIQPLRTRTRQKRKKNAVDIRVRTHKHRGNAFFHVLGFRKSIPPDIFLPGDYDMEFPYSRGVQNPQTGLPRYPKFTVKDSLVPKHALLGKKVRKSSSDDDNSIFEEALSKSSRNHIEKRPAWNFLGWTNSTSDSDDGENDEILLASVRGSSFSADSSRGSLPLDIPASDILPEQDMAAKNSQRKKKNNLGDEMMELRDNIHKLTFHVFHDRTHRIRRKDAVYFGSATPASQHARHSIEPEIERLLNVGQHSSPNPVVTRVGTYVEPIVSAAHSGLALFRAVYNILTWRDPILSFWVSLALLGGAFVLTIFPWRIFFFVTGCVILGPQNYVLRVLDVRRLAPAFVARILDARNEIRNAEQDGANRARQDATISSDQPIIFSHTSDNTPPVQRECDPREVHEVCVPYSQLTYQRTYDWPPEPRYSKCTPTAELDRVAQKLEKTRHRLRTRSSSNHSLSSLANSSLKSFETYDEVASIEN